MVYNAKIARKRATVDLVMHMRQNQTLIDARKTVLRLQEQDAQFAKWALLEHVLFTEMQWLANRWKQP